MRLKVRLDLPCVRVGSMKTVPRWAVDIEQVKHDLTVRNGAYWTAAQNGLATDGLSAYIELFTEDEATDLIHVPRHYELPFLPGKHLHEWDLRYPYTRSAGVDHHIQLRDEVQAEASSTLSGSEQDKILTLACGKGKTVVSLHAAAEGHRFPLLIVVHTNALLDQWRKRISEFYKIPLEEVGHIQGKTVRWRGCRVAVAMLHSLVLKKYESEFYTYWRQVVFDEAHRLGADMFSKASTLFPCERWGLSATVNRPDGMDKVFRLHLGAVGYTNLEQPLQPKVYFVQTNIYTDVGRFMFRRGRVNMPRLTSWLAENDTRNSIITRYVNRMADQGRTILVLGERLNQLHELLACARSSSKSLYIGSMDRRTREDALEQQVVFATQQIAKEGLDRSAFDTLFILVPFGGEGRLQQSVGRILRTHDGKKTPKVVVFVDDISIIGALGRKMRRWVEGQGYEVKDIAVKGARR